jgi:hypothetical protein
MSIFLFEKVITAQTFLVAANYDNTVCERILYTKRILHHNYNHKTINYFLRIKVFLLLMIFSRILT